MTTDNMISHFLPLAIIAFSSTANARAVGKQTITWDACEELNKNISATGLPTENYEPFQCAKLPVPLDYTGCEPGTSELDLFRVQATQEPVLGTILWNPGGPGSTAAVNLPVVASDFHAHVGEQWNLLSWDPRGTGNTIPFKCSALNGEVTASPPTRKRNANTINPANVTDIFLNEGWDAAGETVAACAASNNKTASLIGTSFVARDMIEILDALGEDGMLRFWGFSYGTALGSYFATMFPDRVERMVLDANVNPSAFRDGLDGDRYRDVDATFEGFLDACYENEDDCALAKFVNANSTQDLLDAVNLFFQPLARNASQDFESWVTYAAVRGLIVPQLYTPSTFPTFAENLVAMMNATGEESPESETGTAGEAWSYDQSEGAMQAIRGADATMPFRSARDFLPYQRDQWNSSSLADSAGFLEWQIVQWPTPARERLQGNFTAKTKHPILYVNGEFDPVTPLDHARRAMKGFEGSQLVVHSGFGHGAWADPSTCVRNHVRQYFADGTLPAAEAHCEPDLGPWELAKARNGSMYGAI